MATVERMLERKFQLEKQQAHAVAAAAKKNLGLPKNVMFSKKLIDECQRVAEEKGYLKDGKPIEHQTGFTFRTIGNRGKTTNDNEDETKQSTPPENDSKEATVASTPAAPESLDTSAIPEETQKKEEKELEEPLPAKDSEESKSTDTSDDIVDDTMNETSHSNAADDDDQPGSVAQQSPKDVKFSDNLEHDQPVSVAQQSPKDVTFSDNLEQASSEDVASPREKSSKHKSSKGKSKDELSSSKHKSKDDLSSSKHKSKDDLSSSKHKSKDDASSSSSKHKSKDPLSSSKHKSSKEDKSKQKPSRTKSSKDDKTKSKSSKDDTKGKSSKQDSSSIKSSSTHSKDQQESAKEKEATKENDAPVEKKKKPIQLFDGLILDGPLPILSDNAKAHRTIYTRRQHSDDGAIIDAKGSQARMKRRNRPRRASISGIATCRWESSPGGASNANMAVAAVTSAGGNDESRWRTDQQRINQNMAEQKHIRPQQQTLQIPTRSSDEEDSQNDVNRSSSLPLLKPHRRGSIE